MATPEQVTAIADVKSGLFQCADVFDKGAAVHLTPDATEMLFRVPEKDFTPYMSVPINA